MWTCDEDIYEEAVSILAENGMNVKEMKGNVFKGEIETGKDGLLLLTVPYDKGWKITVDGKKASPKVVLDTFIGLKLDKGIHQVEMTYSPPGFIAGVLISLISMYIAVGYFLYKLEPNEKNKNKISQSIKKSS